MGRALQGGDAPDLRRADARRRAREPARRVAGGGGASVRPLRAGHDALADRSGERGRGSRSWWACPTRRSTASACAISTARSSWIRRGLRGRYDKMHLVPFGEYVPLKRLLFFVEAIAAEIGDFTPGRQVAILPLEGSPFGTVICYEVIFPGLFRRFVAEGASFMTNITNDAWFGDSGGPLQHLRWCRSGRSRTAPRSCAPPTPACRRSCSRRARSRACFRSATRGTLRGDVPLRRGYTFYTRFGDVFAYALRARRRARLLAGLAAGRRAVAPCWASSGASSRTSSGGSTTSGGIFDLASKEARIAAIDAEMANAGFWDDSRRAQALVRERNDLSRLVGRTGELSSELARPPHPLGDGPRGGRREPRAGDPVEPPAPAQGASGVRADRRPVR